MAHFERSRHFVMAMLAVSIVVAGLLGPTTASAEPIYCRIQGGGWFEDALGRKITFAVNLGSDNDAEGTREHFETKAWPIYGRVMLESLEAHTCSPSGPDPRDGGTLEFEGTGRCHDGSAVEIQGSLTDAGEARNRTEDGYELTTRGVGAPPSCTIASGGPLGGGNIRYMQDFN